MVRLACVSALVLSLLTDTPNLRAQTYQGGIRGAVREAGGVIPGATLTLVEEATNISRTAVTNEVGEYVFSNVKPSIYRLATVVDGFKPFERTGIEIDVQRFLVVDISLELGSVTESITVTAGSPVLETATASLGTSLKSVEMETLPTASRNPFYLSITTPNVVFSGLPQFNRMQDQFSSSALSIAGGPLRGNNYTLDGVPITDLYNRAVIIPSIEAIEEVKIQVSTYDAEMGRTGGGVFNTFHSTGSNSWRGSALVQTRPDWAVGQLYFEREAGEPKTEGYYWVYGGSFGGPIVRDNTFFWGAMEGYRTSVTRNAILTLPTAAEARGDFSQSGRTIYDPLNTQPDPNNPGQFLRAPFPGNVIPADRLDPAGLNLAAYLAARGSGALSASANVVDAADQASFNLHHRFGDRYSLSGTYMYYDSNEPLQQYYGGPSDPANGFLFRQVNVVAINNTFIPRPDSVVTFRYGYTSFVDEWNTPEFDPAELGFTQNFLDQISADVFPEICIDGYGAPGWCTHGGWASDDGRHYSHAVNGTLSRFLGNHSVKLGGDYRRLGFGFSFGGPRAGTFFFDGGFTQGPDPNNPGPDTGDALANLLLGYPVEGNLFFGYPLDQYVDYFGGFVQDDWRVSEHLVVNLGLRIEHESGLREKNNRLTVGFDRETPWPVQPVEGMNLRGGLMYAGVDGYPEQQGDPTAIKLGPRAGFAWSLGEKTVLRGGYGAFWAPEALPDATARGFETSTTYFATSDGGLTPAGRLSDPFPNGVEEPIGTSLGLLTGAGGDVDFADQFKQSPYVQQYSAEIDRELPGDWLVSAGYLGSRTDRLTVRGRVNINQLDPRYFELGSSLQERVPNPFYGDPIFGNLSETETISRAQLLRPYPQFGNLAALAVGEGKRRYHSVVLRAEKRFRSGWGGRVNYTFSRNDDNIYGEGNAFSRRTNTAVNAYDLDAEYSRSISDSPHRLNVSGIIELPFGQGERWLDEDGLWSALFGGWTFSATGYYQSGFPMAVTQRLNNTGLLGDLQRPNVVPGVDPGHEGSTVDNLDSYLNPAAWSLAPAFTFGGAPRTDTRIRTPMRANWDFAFQKTARVSRASMTVRAEVINAFDRPDFAGPIVVFGNPNFGKIQSVNGFPRLFQFMLRFAW